MILNNILIKTEQNSYLQNNKHNKEKQNIPIILGKYCNTIKIFDDTTLLITNSHFK